MNHELKELLSLDSICRFMTQGERIRAIKGYLNQNIEMTNKMISGLNLIDAFQWEAPEMCYGQDRLLYYKENGCDKHISEYTHPIINEIQKLKQDGHI